MKGFFISGIGTDVGKTLVSAILCEAWKADYWKPVQSGGQEHSDGMEVARLISNPVTQFHRETYALPFPLSPHASAALAGIEIDPGKFILPETDNLLIVEGAGGLMVPLNSNFMVVDLIKQLGIPVILVSRHYLGSINHTLLSIEILKNRGISFAGIVFNGDENRASEEVIMKYCGNVQMLGRIPAVDRVDRDFVSEQARLFMQVS